MIIYMIGLCLVAQGLYYLQSLDDWQLGRRLKLIVAFANIYSSILFIWGIFIFEWYIPFVSVMALPICLKFFYKVVEIFFSNNNKFHLLLYLKHQLEVIVGVILLTIALIQYYK